MKIIVGIKHVPDTETKIKIDAAGALDESAIAKWVISPFDEYALEEALKLREAQGSGEVVLVCAGREAAQQTLRQGLAMGADRAVLIAADGFDRADGLTRARALAAVVRESAADLVLLGKYGVGADEGQTAPMLAELLGWPHASAISKLELTDGSFRVEREIEGAVEIQEGSLPAVLSCEKGLNEPRYPSLKGIMAAKKKPIETRSLADVGIDPAALGAGALLVWESLELPAERSACRIVPGAPEEAARELARLLKEEAKVI